jgi:hypothetical protein
MEKKKDGGKVAARKNGGKRGEDLC